MRSMIASRRLCSLGAGTSLGLRNERAWGCLDRGHCCPASLPVAPTTHRPSLRAEPPACGESHEARRAVCPGSAAFPLSLDETTGGTRNSAIPLATAAVATGTVPTGPCGSRGAFRASTVMPWTVAPAPWTVALLPVAVGPVSATVYDESRTVHGRGATVHGAGPTATTGSTTVHGAGATATARSGTVHDRGATVCGTGATVHDGSGTGYTGPATGCGCGPTATGRMRTARRTGRIAWATTVLDSGTKPGRQLTQARPARRPKHRIHPAPRASVRSRPGGSLRVRRRYISSNPCHRTPGSFSAPWGAGG